MRDARGGGRAVRGEPGIGTSLPVVVRADTGSRRAGVCVGARAGAAPMALPFLLTGVWMAAHGGYTLVHYLGANPRAQTVEGARA